MNTAELYRLQSRQREHDERHHTDIFGGDPKRRMTHYELHYAKYVGRMAELLKKDDAALIAGLEKILTDTFIITLAASDALNIEFNGAAEQAASAPPQQSKKGAAEEFFYDLAIYQGGIAKALDSYDHLENFACSEQLRSCTKDIMRVVLVAANRIGMNLEPATFTRWTEIAAKRIL